MARLYCSPRSISVSSLSRCDCMATRGSSIYRVMATTLAIRKMSSRAKPRWPLGRGRGLRRGDAEEECPHEWGHGSLKGRSTGSELSRATGILRNLDSLFAFDIGVFDDHRLGIDAHDLVALFHGHALGGEDDLLAIQEERGFLAIDALGGQTIILHGNGRRGCSRHRSGRGRRSVYRGAH